MSHASAVRHHLADKHATWIGNEATWTEDGREHLLLLVEGALRADAVVDAHVRALGRGATLTLAVSADPTPVARRTAERLNIRLLDAATLPDAPAPAPPEAPAPVAPEPLLPSHPAPPMLPAHEPLFELAGEIASAWSDALAAIERRDAPTPAAPPVEEVVVAHSDPAPEVAHADPALPWDLSVSAPEPEPVHVEAAELATMPWNLHPEQHELLPAGREARLAPVRPTQVAQEWGLPWPRPVVPTGGLAIADPKLWHAQERIGAVREDLAKAGAPSFGAVKPEGSAWLKRLHEFGAP